MVRVNYPWVQLQLTTAGNLAKSPKQKKKCTMG